MSDHASFTSRNGKCLAADIGTKYFWPRGYWITLIEFAESALWQEEQSLRLDQSRKIVAAISKRLEASFRGIPRKQRSIPYRADDGTTRYLEAEIKQCQESSGKARHKMLYPVQTKAHQWIVWNLAPFFQTRDSDPVSWRDLVRFLNCVPFSARLAANRKARLNKTTLISLEAKRIEAVYKRIPADRPRDRKIERLLNQYRRHRVDSPLNHLHERAFEIVKDRLS